VTRRGNGGVACVKLGWQQHANAHKPLTWLVVVTADPSRFWSSRRVPGRANRIDASVGGPVHLAAVITTIGNPRRQSVRLKGGHLEICGNTGTFAFVRWIYFN
jgi:hypothetical protein